jgi:hypothetical protein
MTVLADKCRQHAELSKLSIVVVDDMQEPGESFVAEHLLKLQPTH